MPVDIVQQQVQAYEGVCSLPLLGSVLTSIGEPFVDVPAVPSKTVAAWALFVVLA